jgi:predicted Holliday junction resolvase-like endonuclease
MDRQDTDNRLDALEKSLQAAQHSIIQSSPWQQQQQQNVMKQEVRQFETRTYETKTEQRQEQRHEQQRVSREEINGGYPRSMSPVWDNFEHVSIRHPV